MTDIPVGKASEAGSSSADTDALAAQIRRLAYHLFESRGGRDGGDVNDWLIAERQLIVTPESVLVARDGKFEIQIPAEGYEARQIHISASPGSLAVRADSDDETGHKALLGTIDLPGPIDVDRTTARLDKGILFVTAIRQSREREPASV